MVVAKEGKETYTVKLRKDLKKTLNLIKIENDFKSISDVISFLLEKYYENKKREKNE